MKALTVKQPWAWAIMHAGKDVENRGQRTRYRGQLIIHAGKGEDREAYSFPALKAAIPTQELVFLRGEVLGTVELIDCHHADECGNSCSEWSEDGYWHWCFASPVATAFPYPAKGQLGLWNLQQNESQAAPTAPAPAPTSISD